MELSFGVTKKILQVIAKNVEFDQETVTKNAKPKITKAYSLPEFLIMYQNNLHLRSKIDKIINSLTKEEVKAINEFGFLWFSN